MNNRKSGFTLIEGFASAVIIAVGLFAVITTIYIQFNFVSQARDNAIAALAAQEEIEKLRGMGFDNILALGSTSNFTVPGLAYLRSPAGTVKIDNIYGVSDIRRVSVTVSWKLLSGRSAERSLATLITRNGIDKQ